MRSQGWRESTRRPRRWPPTVGISWQNPSAARGSTRLRCASGSPPTPTQPAKTRWPERILLRVAFITVGDTGRKTGGYLYNGRVISGLRKRGFEIEEVVAGGATNSRPKIRIHIRPFQVRRDNSRRPRPHRGLPAPGPLAVLAACSGVGPRTTERRRRRVLA